MAAHPQMLTQEFLLECFSFDPESGVLTWRVRPLEHFKNARDCKGWNTRYSGKKAGRVTNYGYRAVGINSRWYLAHRVIWKLETGHWPERELDHISGNRLDNRMSNLRQVTPQENKRNASIRKDNTSGITGVYWDARINKWVARIKVCGKDIYLGVFPDKAEAIAARKSAEVQHGFHKNHGKPRVAP